MNSWGRVLLAGLPALFVLGCPDLLPPECDEDADCPQGQVCADGHCVAEDECDADEDCPQGEVCENGACVPEDECDEDADCPAGQVCNEATDECVECIAAVDCNDNDACTNDTCVASACVNVSIACVVVADCPAGCNAACTNGVCSD